MDVFRLLSVRGLRSRVDHGAASRMAAGPGHACEVQHAEPGRDLRCVAGQRALTCRATATFLSVGSGLAVSHATHGQTVPALLEVADFDKRGPQLNRAFDDGDDVIDDPRQVLLKG